MRFIFKELRSHLWRTIASISGYALASLFILLILSINGTNEKDSFGILKGTGTHFILYIPSKTSCCVNEKANGSIFADGVYTQMLDRSLIDSVKGISGVRDAAPYLLYEMYDETFKAQISLGGIDTGSIATKNNVCAVTNLIAGQLLSDNPNKITAEESFATGHHLSIGDTMQVFGGNMILGGIINSGIKPGKADFYSSIDNVRRILKDQLKCKSEVFDMNIILVEATNARIQESIMNQLKKQMPYISLSSYNCYQPASQVMNIITGTSVLLSVLIFTFLIIFSVKTQLTSLMERYRELGILKSLGWKNSSLSNQILFSSVIQSLIGAIVGIFLAEIIILIINFYHFRLFSGLEFHTQFKIVILILALSLTGAIIASIFPIIKLNRSKAGDMINNYL